VSALAKPGVSAQEAASVVTSATDLEPEVALILGSGLGAAVDALIKEEATIAYSELPGFKAPTVPGHEGRLSLWRIGGRSIAVFHGRVHLYEGDGMDPISLIPLLSAELGVRTMVVTGAVGALVPEILAGTIVVLRDHVNMMGTTPLRGWFDRDGTPAFIPMAVAYEPRLRALALEAAEAQGIRATDGVYAAVAGPTYETPAEVAFLRSAGATVVGMSVVPEVVMSRAFGMSVLGLCSVTNALGAPVSHEEVVRVSDQTATAVGRLLVDLLPRVGEGVKDA